MHNEPQPESPSDAELLERIGAGGEEAFIELYRRRRHDVFKFAYALARSVSIAQDVTQDTFLNVLEHGSRYDAEKGTVRAWLYGCARHIVLDRFRADSRLAGGTRREEEIACNGEDEVFRDQQVRRLHAEIMQLPLEYREALVLCELAELSYAETATALGCPVGTVRSRLHRARALLAQGLGSHDSAAPAMLKTTEACS
jgi:RNA polymerase sigma-70 factor (ECF subfamily)